MIAASAAGQAIHDNNAEEKREKDGSATESTISAKKKTGGRKKGTPNLPNDAAKSAAKKASFKRWWKAKQRKKANPPERAQKVNKKPQGGWPKEDLMEEHFPGLDDRLRDLREWMLTRVGFPENDHKEVYKGVKDGIKHGISNHAGTGTYY